MSVRFEDIDPEGELALMLLQEAAAEVHPLYPEQHAGGATVPTNPLLQEGEVYVAAFLDRLAEGCGALRRRDETTAEVRRMFVRRDARRRGVGRALRAELVSEARRLGYKRLVLETGCRQQPAMKLYESFGFRVIPPFGEYVKDPTSVCYELLLSSA